MCPVCGAAKDQFEVVPPSEWCPDQISNRRSKSLSDREGRPPGCKMLSSQSQHSQKLQRSFSSHRQKNDAERNTYPGYFDLVKRSNFKCENVANSIWQTISHMPISLKNLRYPWRDMISVWGRIVVWTLIYPITTDEFISESRHLRYTYHQEIDIEVAFRSSTLREHWELALF